MKSSRQLFNTGRVQEKMGVNKKPFPDKTPVSFVLLDNNHLTEHGVTYFCKKSKEFVLITSNKDHPAYNIKENNLHIILLVCPDSGKIFIVVF